MIRLNFIKKATLFFGLTLAATCLRADSETVSKPLFVIPIKDLPTNQSFEYFFNPSIFQNVSTPNLSTISADDLANYFKEQLKNLMSFQYGDYGLNVKLLFTQPEGPDALNKILSALASLFGLLPQLPIATLDGDENITYEELLIKIDAQEGAQILKFEQKLKDLHYKFKGEPRGFVELALWSYDIFNALKSASLLNENSCLIAKIISSFIKNINFPIKEISMLRSQPIDVKAFLEQLPPDAEFLKSKNLLANVSIWIETILNLTFKQTRLPFKPRPGACTVLKNENAFWQDFFNILEPVSTTW